jgi:subtilisin family serine protease
LAEGRLEATGSRTIFGLKRGLLICGLLAFALAPAARAEPVEVVVTMKPPSLAAVFARDRSLAFSSFARPRRLLLSAPASRDYLRRLQSAQRTLQDRIRASIPRAEVRWRYGIVLNGFALVVPQRQVDRLALVPGVERVWPSVRYSAQLDTTPQLIGAPALWGPSPALPTAGQGMKIGIIDDGIDQTHPFFAPTGYAYPSGFPKGQTAYTTPKVIVARAFPPPRARHAAARLPFDPALSEHGTHVAGIAAGNNETPTDAGERISGIAPRAYLGNYKALTVPTPAFGLNGNAPELAAAIEAAVRDGMDVVNLSLGEPEIEPSRDVVAKALNAAADAGVVSAVAANNEFGQFGFGSVGSPANAQGAIAAGASTGGSGAGADAPASFSSAGPTPYSLRLKPDVTAPGTDVLSSLPDSSFGELSGTSMSSPHVAGAAALLRQRHPEWTASQVKSALVLTGAPVRSAGEEVSPLREGGGRIDLVRADRPLVFARPTGLSFGLLRAGAAATRSVTLTDAGGGAGSWTVRVLPSLEAAVGTITVPTQATVPGNLQVRVVSRRGAPERDVSAFLVLSRGSDRRRIPFWFRVTRPRLRLEPRAALLHTGVYRASTARGVARVSSYRYPDVPTSASFPVRLPGREIVYRVQVRRRIANFGVAVVARDPGVRVEPRIVRAGDENRLAGYTALPLDLNPYRGSYGRHRLVAGVVLPAPGSYDIVFDTPRRGRSGGFRFLYWQGDTTPPAVRVLAVGSRFLELSVTDRGSGVDPTSLDARIGERAVPASYAAGRARISLAGLSRGRHVLTFRVADHQETKNMEDVFRILPNTRTVQTSFVVR